MKIDKLYPFRPLSLVSLCLACWAGAVYAHPEEECVTDGKAVAAACEADTTVIPPAGPPEPTVIASDEPSYAVGNESVMADGDDFSMLSDTGYIDSALVRTQFRLRYDWNNDSEFPDRAEFIYGQCDCGPEGVSPGPALEFDYQELEFSLEYAFTPRFSVFTEIPVRDVDLETADLSALGGPGPRSIQKSGLGDIKAGFKYAMIAEQDQYLTFQLRGYFPTGDADKNLGTNHSTVEPALLYYRRLSERWSVETEARWWLPLADSTDYAGDVLRFGAGIAYHGLGSAVKVTPIAELVGWYVLDGFKTQAEPVAVLSAKDDTIVNLKLGVRVRVGNHPGSLYLGYGFALTNQDWYDDVFRVEYRYSLGR